MTLMANYTLSELEVQLGLKVVPLVLSVYCKIILSAMTIIHFQSWGYKIKLLQREVSILKRVNHEHIINLRAVFETSQVNIMFMPAQFNLVYFVPKMVATVVRPILILASLS